MKNFVFILIALCCLNSYSQIGVTLGVTNTSNELYDDVDFSLGYAASVFARLNLGPVAFRPELGFYQEKLTYNYQTISYADIFGPVDDPILPTFAITSNNLRLGNSFEILLGPVGIHFGSSLAVLMNQTSKVTIDGDTETITINFDDIDVLDRTALLGHLGITINITNNLFAELRYNTTLALGVNDFDIDIDNRTSVVGVNIGLSL